MDRDAKFCDSFRDIVDSTGTKPVRLLPQSPNPNAHLERFVRSVKSESLARMIFFGENSLRTAVLQYLLHYQHERNHQGLGNQLIDTTDEVGAATGKVHCRKRLGGLLHYYYRDAA